MGSGGPAAGCFLYLLQLLKALDKADGFVLNIYNLESVLHSIHMLKDYQFGGVWIDALETSVEDCIRVSVGEIAKLERTREQSARRLDELTLIRDYHEN